MPEQFELFAVPNPCRGVCLSDERGFCRGCFRSRNERFTWGQMSEVQKQDVLRLCRQRMKRRLRSGKSESPAESRQPSLF
ncbi:MULTISPECIES: DUF1289 domain-containing protein [Brenneria]|uniref:DUF1289 domain-containing protein n=1 Tax=Brenneria nigrifluens DSM 30175 = ATCC 13028 TaxID=1121120 RepID=A0A2U1UT56_9GAMM|nr:MULTISPECIES: DUF1289 domain-containing protein [Brenneria]EHD21633.1 protein of unknown function DUF1289 [Brenneria sp. EniD312]PWC24826.1 DUF1289 domain-containing protein [Brenneria nigrifluens DSM 30175 = ATCC 13028]QCR04751.1 DUF1289 domain-containing protein [Brenneria nigrifluens DSM 30175 = ATCC 13028]